MTIQTTMHDQLAALRAETSAYDTKRFLEFAINRVFSGQIAVVSSFGSESVVMLHHVAQIDPTVPVLFLNTGKLFGETLRYRDRLQDVLGLTDVRGIGPHPLERDTTDPDGTLYSRDPDGCCHLRKVLPLGRALGAFKASITGRKRFQTEARSLLSRIDLADGRFSFNPLVEWNQAELARYIEEHRLPVHPLVSDGYLSIGCLPCTRRVRAGENYRSGRWAGFEKEECGMHPGLDGDGI